MLVLRRRQNETINIGPDIRVTVTAIDWRSVKLGIDAPLSYAISRGPRCPRKRLPPLRGEKP